MGIKQHLILDKYDWKITIYYTVNSIQKEEILGKLNAIGCDKETRLSIKANLDRGAENTGFTYSSYSSNESIMVIHKASCLGEFINTFEHEKNHLEMHICEALSINPYSEEAAHLSGDLAQLIFEKALYSIVEL